MLNFYDVLQSIKPLSSALLNHLESILRYELIPKGKHLLHEGQPSGMMCFVSEGILQCYKKTSDAVKISRFLSAGDLYFSPHYSILPSTGRESLQALENTAVWYVSKEQLTGMYENFAEFNFYGRVLLQDYHLATERANQHLWLRSAYDRYEYFRNNFPRLLERVPVKYLSCYLQISRFTLSRMRISSLKTTYMNYSILHEDWSDYDNRKLKEGGDRLKFCCENEWEVDYLVKKIKKRYPRKKISIIKAAITATCQSEIPKTRLEFVEHVMKIIA